MFPSLPQEPARTYALKLMQELESQRELADSEHGLMFGVLVCNNPASDGEVVLKAFSGQYFGRWLVDGWVPPLLDVEAYNAQVARDDGRIQELTREIAALERSLERSLCGEVPAGQAASSAGTQAELRLQLKILRGRRRRLSKESLAAIYKLYRFPCADGRTRTFADLYPGFAQGKLPPTGTGDCCGPKLLGAAFSRGLVPVSMVEFFFGGQDANCSRSPSSCIPEQARHHKEFYPPCDEKCGLVLPAMLGLEILYQDESIVIVNKSSGLLSVPGRGLENQDCVVTRLQRLFPRCISQPSVHRLDQDTSGLLVLALTQEAHRELSRQFMEGSVYKEYEALLRGRVVACGWQHLELPFRLDVENRPRQIYDEVHGKIGITDWKVLSYHRCPEETCSQKVLTRVLFVPKTGRTHQLRLHAMHEKGIGAPIQGDRLYGTRLAGERLMLHASRIRFVHPKTKLPVEFSCPAPF